MENKLTQYLLEFSKGADNWFNEISFLKERYKYFPHLLHIIKTALVALYKYVGMHLQLNNL